MRRLFIYTILLCCLGAVACKKVKGPANGKSVQPNNNRDSTVAITATINGAAWTTDSVFAYLQPYSGNDSGAYSLMINAVNYASNTTMTFYITNYTGPNTYAITPPYNTATYYVGNKRNYASAGQIIIASDTAYALKGSFNFIADTVTVNSGTFNASAP
jgi:hypothetical protein